MTDKPRSRFGLSGDAEGMAGNIQPFNRTPEPKPIPAKMCHVRRTKETSLLELIPVQLEPRTFSSAVVANVIRPAVPHEDHLNLVVDLIEQALHEAETSGKATLTRNQLSGISRLVAALTAGIGEAMTAAGALEWSLALHSLCLRHLMDHPTPAEAKKTNAVRASMIHEMEKFIDEPVQEEGDTHE